MTMTDSRHPRRRSWLQNTAFTIFTAGGGRSSASCGGRASPPSRKPSSTEPPARSRSVDNVSLTSPPKSSSTLAALISKAARRGLKRLPTVDVLRVDDTRSEQSIEYKRSKLVPGHSAPTPPPDDVEDDTPCTFIMADEAEIGRMEFKNDLVRLAFEEEFAIPFDLNELHGGKVLDVGCGPGCWCMELAQRYPNVDVYGIDIVDMFPTSATPINCTFLLISALDQGLLFEQFEDGSLDYIHIRFMTLSFTFEQFARVVQSCWRLLKPGGYLELMEMDMMIYSPGAATEKMNQDMLAAARSRGLNPRLPRRLWSLMPDGAICAVEKYRSLPLGVWGGRLGVMYRDDWFNMMKNCQGAVNQFKEANQMSEVMSTQDFESYLQIVSKELEQYHSYGNFYFTVARKPLQPSPST